MIALESYFPLFVSILFIIIILAFLLTQLTFEKRTLQLENEKGNKITLKVEIADNSFKRSLGLMFRTTLKENEGMFFVFSNEAPRNFWMFNTKIPLDALHFNAKNQLVDYISMAPCKSLVCPTYPSHQRAQYVLEVNRGFSSKYTLTKDTSFSFIHSQ